jgi:uncharacterized protein YjbK
MKAKLEVETKLELDAEGFEKIISSGELKTCIVQINHYFDDHWKLADHASTLRVRLTTTKKPQVTFKTPVHTCDGKRTSKEIEFELDKEIFQHVLSGDKDFFEILPNSIHENLDKLGVRDLQYIGSVKNQRYVIQTKHGTIEADHLELPGGHDYYEAEIESDKASVHRHLVTFVNKLVPTAHPSHISKFERFRKAVAQV